MSLYNLCIPKIFIYPLNSSRMDSKLIEIIELVVYEKRYFAQVGTVGRELKNKIKSRHR